MFSSFSNSYSLGYYKKLIAIIANYIQMTYTITGTPNDAVLLDSPAIYPIDFVNGGIGKANGIIDSVLNAIPEYLHRDAMRQIADIFSNQFGADYCYDEVHSLIVMRNRQPLLYRLYSILAEKRKDCLSGIPSDLDIDDKVYLLDNIDSDGYDVHRDIKMENVMLSFPNRPDCDQVDLSQVDFDKEEFVCKICDFGLSA